MATNLNFKTGAADSLSSATKIAGTLLLAQHDNSYGSWYYDKDGTNRIEIVPSCLPVSHGGTGLSSLTSGYALIGAGTNAISLRAITDFSSKGYISASDNLITANTLAFWNGAYNKSGDSNLTYYAQGAFGNIATKNYDYFDDTLVLVSYENEGFDTYNPSLYVGQLGNSFSMALASRSIQAYDPMQNSSTLYLNPFGGDVWIGEYGDGIIVGQLEGNAGTATALAYARTINGTKFNGSDNIETSYWGSSRAFSVTDSSNSHTGNSVQVNGSGAVTLFLPSIITADIIGDVTGDLLGNATTATVATKLGTSTIGNAAKPIYLDNGTATACSSTVGSGIIPVYMSSGTITPSTSTVGSATNPVYMSSGTITVGSTYAGGTAVTLNGTSKAATTASFYAPTNIGSNKQILKCNGSNIPVWSDLWINAQGSSYDMSTILSESSTDLSVYWTSADTLNTDYTAGITSLSQSFILNFNRNANYGTQIAIAPGGLISYRRKNGGTINDWQKILSNISYSQSSSGVKISATFAGGVTTSDYFPVATGSAPGLLSATAQTIGGAKTFTGKLFLTNNVTYGTTLPSTGTEGQVFFLLVD